MNDDIIISAEDFSRILAQKCKEYTDDVKQEVADGLEKIGKETLEEVKNASPVYAGKSKKIKKGAYKKGWTISKTQAKGETQIVIHNKKYYLVHLLENGHVLRDGTGRICGEVQPKKHVEPAENHANEKVDALLERLTNGT